MRMIANILVTTSLVAVAALAAGQARAANVDATSAVDAVTVYPDGASVTRVIAVDLPAGDNTLVLKDFPLTLDPSSLRVEGEGGSKLTIGAIDTRPPRAAPPVNLPELDRRIEALKDERANLQGAIAAASARRKFAERFAEASPAGIGDKGEARPIAEWRTAFAAVAEEVATADSAIRDAERKQRDIDREISRLESDRAVKPPARLEVRIDLAAAAATKATLRVTYAVRPRAGRRSMMPGSIPGQRIASLRSNWCVAPRSRRRRGRIGRMWRWPSRRSGPRAAAARLSRIHSSCNIRNRRVRCSVARSRMPKASLDAGPDAGPDG